MLPREIFTAEDFVKQHNHINYCEAIIFPNGSIAYAIPSHQERFMKVYQKINGFKTKQEAWDSISPWEFSLYWLAEKTGCVGVWFNQLIIPENVTINQIETLQKLLEAGAISQTEEKVRMKIEFWYMRLDE